MLIIDDDDDYMMLIIKTGSYNSEKGDLSQNRIIIIKKNTTQATLETKKHNTESAAFYSNVPKICREKLYYRDLMHNKFLD